MSNMILGWPNRIDDRDGYTPSLSGGSWNSNLPLTNLQDWRLARVARTTSSASAASTFDVDLGVARPIFVIAMIRHNCTSSAMIQVRADNAGTFAAPVYDTGTVAVIVTAAQALDWGDLVPDWVNVPSSAQSCRYWRINLYDTTNPGPIELGRFVLAEGWQPTINMSYGAQLGLKAQTTVRLTDGGSPVYTARPNRRTLECAIEDLPEAEALDSWFHMQRRADLDDQIYVIYDPADSYHYHRAFLANVQSMQPLRAAIISRYGTPLSLIEVL